MPTQKTWRERFDEKFIKVSQWELVPNTPRKIMMNDSDVMVMMIGIKSFIESLLEEQREERRINIEEINKEINKEIAGIAGILNGSAVGDSGQAHIAQMKLGKILSILDILCLQTKEK